MQTGRLGLVLGSVSRDRKTEALDGSPDPVRYLLYSLALAVFAEADLQGDIRATKVNSS